MRVSAGIRGNPRRVKPKRAMRIARAYDESLSSLARFARLLLRFFSSFPPSPPTAERAANCCLDPPIIARRAGKSALTRSSVGTERARESEGSIAGLLSSFSDIRIESDRRFGALNRGSLRARHSRRELTLRRCARSAVIQQQQQQRQQLG